MNHPTDQHHRDSGWMRRDFVAAAGLLLATAAIVLWQNAHLVVLWDLSYVLDSATRMAQGQMPYRDFPFAHAPLTFLMQAAMIRLTGRVFFHHVLYCALVGGVGTVLAWRIVFSTLCGAWWISVMLAAPLTVLGIYCILPHPSYDCDCAFSILCALWLLQRLERHSTGDSEACRATIMWSSFAAGAAAVLPLFFKQNIGLVFLAAVVAALFVLLGARVLRLASASPGTQALLAALGGVATALAAAALLLYFTAGVRNYVHWTIGFAARRRLPGLQQMIGVYREPALLWMLPCVAVGILMMRGLAAQRGGENGLSWSGHAEMHAPGAKAPTDIGESDVRAEALTYRSETAVWANRFARFRNTGARIAVLGLLAAPFVWTVASLLVYDDADERGDSLLALWPLLLILSAALTLWNLRRGLSLRALLPGVVLLTINGTLMSQQLWGSTYAIWPLPILLIAEMVVFLGAVEEGERFYRSSKVGIMDSHPSRKNKDAARVGHPFALVIAVVVAGTLLVCGGFYTASEERLSYAQFPDGPVVHATFPQLAGMATPGPYLPNLEELLRFAAANIPDSDGIILIPGEDPFYFATGRRPQFPVLLFDPATDPYSPDEVLAQARDHNIRWLIVKRELQIKEDPTPQREAVMKALLGEFALDTQLQGYDVYRRR